MKTDQVEVVLADRWGTITVRPSDGRHFWTPAGQQSWQTSTHDYQGCLDSYRRHIEFWLEKVRWQHEPPKDRTVVRIDGVHYLVAPETDHPASMRGFGGRRFNIRMHDDDRLIVTTNLWSQGAIPPTMLAELQDNAHFEEVV